MATRNLYLHETVDIVGQGQYDYMACVTREPTNVMPDMLTLQGTFFVCAVGGGRWPQVVNIWDVGDQGWRGWAANVDRLNLKRRNAFYGDWWDEAAQWRTGGFDRLCGGVPGSPTTGELAAGGVRGTLFVHQLLTVRPGCPLDYLAAVVEEVRTATPTFLQTAVRAEVAALRAELDEDDRMLLTLRVDRGLPWRELAQVFAEDGETIASPAALDRQAAALRKRYERIKRRIRALAEARGIVDVDA